ncbi:hypothetical protein [Rubripirellula reticaptiva]|uniref:Transmembrane protein n=1 Tax=Rubripirellula reticaptiva TaxID=2528013 RepID=A0A5C6EKV4_9BACT|nr:hypothetical protein [Rubripirellula reticaptiva]TWU48226.1 hypothetical protein Poly59_50720 [Rubripirellula reticaptiva]
MRQLIALVLFIGFVSPPVFRLASAQNSESQSFEVQDIANQGSASQESSAPLSADNIQRSLTRDSPIDADDIAAASGWASGSGIVDWLGPLAPVALSPFFGVTCLSGLALWGPDWATNNAVLGVAGPLRNETLFFIFLGLTLLTSLPRLTKVSKPFAQALDRLETYAVIVILLSIKFVMSMEMSGDEVSGEPQIAMVQFGVVSMSIDTLLAIAMVINVLVINSVKFFFEFLVWLTPVPFLDAIFEVCNKSLCAVLMGIYAYSPTIATGINLAVLIVAALMLRWISRRVRFYRTMTLDPILAKLWTSFGTPRKPELIVFPTDTFGPFKAKSRLRMAVHPDGGWKLCEANWWMPGNEHLVGPEAKPAVRAGWVMNTLIIKDVDGREAKLTFSRRYNEAKLSALLRDMGMDEAEIDEVVDQTLATQFA